MSFGIVELITLLLGLSGFGLQANPKAPTPDVALEYAMPNADIVVHVDAQSVIPGNYRVLSKLADQPAIKASPEMAKAVRKMVNEVEGIRGLAKSTVGVDITTDIHDATAFVQFVPNGEPNFVAAVRGRFTPKMLDKIGAMTGNKPVKLHGGTLVETGQTEPALAVTNAGVLLAGTPKLVRDRLANNWRAAPRAPNSLLANAADLIATRPVFAVASALSADAKKLLFQELATKDWSNPNGPPKRTGNFATDLMQRHKYAALAVYHDGVGWSWVDSNRAGLESFTQMSEGVIDVMRAGQIAPRGVAKVLMGALESYRGTSRQVDELIRRKADLLKIVESYTGDGNFKVAIDKQVAQNRVNVRATGKSLSDVVPAGVVIPLFLVGTLASGEAKSAAMPPPAAVHPVQPKAVQPPPPPPPRPAQPKPQPRGY